LLADDLRLDKEGRLGIIIALAGLQLTRKAQGAYVAREEGYGVISTGGFIRQICTKRGLQANYTNMKQIAEEMVASGEPHLLEQLIPDINASVMAEKGVVIDSIKSLEGIEYLRANFPKVVVVGFLASDAFRFEHSRLRSRLDDAQSRIEFDERDRRELAMGLAEVVVRADYFVLADDVESTREQFRRILGKIKREVDG